MKIQHWLSGLCKPVRRRRGRAAVATESLETKALLSVTTQFHPTIGELEVRSDADDAIAVTASQDGTDVLVNGQSTGVAPADVQFLEIKGGPLNNTLDASGVTAAVFTNIQQIELKGGAGDDVLIGSELNDELKGGTGNDNLDGGAGNDELKGEAGDDTLTGGVGDDSLDGREGNDDIRGGAGDDTIGAGGDDDSVTGGGGDDSIKAGSGHDSVHGGSGSDSVRGGGGMDSLDGAGGSDTLIGENGSDSIRGGGGHDDLRGNRGKDRLDGEAGDDSLKGGSSDDLLKGGDDDDSLDGGRGDDILDGDDGDDDERNGFKTDVESTFQAPLSGATSANGKAKFEQAVTGEIELEFEVEVEDAAAGTYDVQIDGVSVGQVVVNSAGDGRLKYSTEPNDADEAQFPDGFPTIDAGSVITIGDLVSGTFAQFQDREFEMPLSPMNGSSASGEVKYEADGPEREFELRADNVASGSYDLIVDGVVVDTIQVTSGRVRIEYKDEDDGSTFPENFPDIDVGSTIELEGVLNGQF